MGHEFEPLSNQIISAAIEVHRTLGPGFLESVYENALVIALRERGLLVEQQVEVPIFFHEQEIGKHRIDLLVNQEILVENKTVVAFEKIHFAITKSYLKATNKETALLFNFNAIPLQIKRIVYEPRDYS